MHRTATAAAMPISDPGPGPDPDPGPGPGPGPAAPLPQQPPTRERRPAGGAARRVRRANTVLLLMWLLGALPALLRLGLGWQVPAGWEAFGWGLWLPGAGFIAAGGWWVLMFPVVWVVFEFAVFIWAISAMLLAPLVVWLGAALWAAQVAGDPVFPQAVWLVPMLGVGVALWRILGERRALAREAVGGRQFDQRLPGLLADLDRRAVAAADGHELDARQLAAARTLFDLALQPVGEFKGFTRIDNFQSASLRYQLNYISYTLAALQCRYTPKFHGYLNDAQRYAIESLARPEVCGYWKWEHLWGRFGWNPDPIGTRDNVMLTGWSQVALTTYAANTGDLRYQTAGALAFKPARGNPRTYGHDAHSFTRSIVTNWQHAPTTLYPCEPHWVFPLCNAYAYSGLVPYDRVNGTRHAAEHHAGLLRSLEADFLLPDGSVRPVLNTLTGWAWMSRAVPGQVTLGALLQLCRVGNAFHPGHARRWYLMAREQFVSVDGDGRLQLRGMTWESLLDAGHYRKGPGYLLGMLALAAREFGDEAVAEAALREADLRLAPGDDGATLYRGVSTVSNINLAAARLAGLGDWQTLIVRGPGADALRGPVLGACAYPQVLVAAAHGDADSLDLVLLPGCGPVLQTLQIERLQPGSRYRVEGATVDALVTGAGQTTATLGVVLDGRTPVRLRREG